MHIYQRIRDLVIIALYKSTLYLTLPYKLSLVHVLYAKITFNLNSKLLYGELTVGQHSVGSPKKCFIDHIKANLLKCNIKPSDLEALASDRDIWRTVIPVPGAS